MRARRGMGLRRGVGVTAGRSAPRPFRAGRRWLAPLLLAVVAAHALALWLLGGLRPLPARPYVPPPNFSAAEARQLDPATGETWVVREYTVGTKLAELAGPAAAAGSPPMPRSAAVP